LNETAEPDVYGDLAERWLRGWRLRSLWRLNGTLTESLLQGEQSYRGEKVSRNEAVEGLNSARR
jgi:hypothetical protein